MASAETPSEPVWKAFTADQYREAIFRLVHFSTKTINSNAKAAGVRLNAANTRPRRYLSASSVLAAGGVLPLDYLTNSGPAATIAKQVDLVLSDNIPDSVDPDEVALVRRIYREASREQFETGMDKVSPRVRQLFLPCDDGDYVAITPITSSGLTTTVREGTRDNLRRWREQRDSKETDSAQPGIRRLLTAYMGFGGSNAQNIGRLPNSGLLQYPLFFSAPRNNQTLQAQYLAARHGVLPLLHRSIMIELRDALLPLQQRHDGELPANLKTRQQLDQFVDRLVASLLHRAKHTRREALEVLHDMDLSASPNDADASDESPASPELSESAETASNEAIAEEAHADLRQWRHLPLIQQGLLEPARRDRRWRRALTARLVTAIDEYTYPNQTTQGRLSFDRSWLARIENRIEENLP